MRPNQHKTLWTVLYSSGAYLRFNCREDAAAESLMYGIGIIEPFYQ